MVVQDARCLPQQSGYTVHALTVTLPPEVNAFALIDLAQNDNGVVQRSCDGWYWSFWPAILVGLTIRFAAAGALHVCNRSKQAKHSMMDELRAVQPMYKNPILWWVGFFMAFFVLLFSLSVWLIQTNRGSSGLIDPLEVLNSTVISILEAVAEEYKGD